MKWIHSLFALVLLILAAEISANPVVNRKPSEQKRKQPTKFKIMCPSKKTLCEHLQRMSKYDRYLEFLRASLKEYSLLRG